MNKVNSKTVKVIVNINRLPASPKQSADYKRFWTKVISTVNDEVKGEQPRSQKPADKDVIDAE